VFTERTRRVDEAAQFGRSDSDTAILASTRTDEVYDYDDADSLPTVIGFPAMWRGWSIT
jgi:hypothetical protein